MAAQPHLQHVAVPPRLSGIDLATPLIVVTAPAGFGKTTLLRAWRDRLREPSALVELDGLLHPGYSRESGEALLRAAESVGVPAGSGKAGLDLIPADGEHFGYDFVAELAAGLSSVPTPFRILIDDLHRLGAWQLEELASLISHVASAQRRFIVSSRDPLDWPLQRWRIEGTLRLLTAAELRLTDDEARAFLGDGLADDVGGSPISGGWPAALQLMKWHAQNGTGLPADRAAEDITEFVAAEVLPALPEGQFALLTELAVLEPFPLEVAVALAGSRSAEQTLNEIAGHTALIDHTQDGRIAIHPMLRTALIEARQRRSPGSDEQLQLRAAQAWLAQPPSVLASASAIDHLIAARAWPQALAVLRHRWPDFEGAAKLDEVVDWFDLIPSQEWLSSPVFGPLYVLANLRIGRSVAALDAVGRINASGERKTIALTRLVLASAVGWDTDPAAALVWSSQAREVLAGLAVEGEQPGFAIYPGVFSYELAAQLSLSQAHALHGDFAEAADGYRALLVSPVSPLTQVTIFAGLGASLAMGGELAEAERWIESALGLAGELDSPFHLRAFPARLGRAIVTALRGDHRSALTQLEEAASIARSNRAANFLHLCDLVAGLCGTTESFLDSVEPPLVHRPLPITDQFLAADAARRDLRLGRQVNAVMRLQRVAAHELTLAAWTEVSIDSRGRAAAAGWLATVPPPRLQHGRLIRMLAEAATAPAAGEAAELAAAAAELAEATGLVGVLADAPRQLWEREVIMSSADPILVAAIGQLASRRGQPELALTGRELELLRLLPLDLRLAELADRLFVSVHTLKWHRANLYRKLGVRSRADAAAKARELGLLPGPR